ncbi:MurR/RpiR family transcriptional regulator [Amedibacillus sp. YH-ame10]
MNNLRKRIQANYYELTNASKLIADVILGYEEKDFDLNLVSLAEKAFCSNAAITKFIHYFGEQSYKVFVRDLNRVDENSSSTIMESIHLVDVYYNQHIDSIQKFIENIKKANNIYLFASGQSQISALDFSTKCNKKQKGKYIFESNSDTQRLLLHTISKDDFIIFISNSGESRELLQFLKEIDNNNLYLVTNRENSSLAKQIEHTICLNNTIESPLGFKEFSKESKYSLLYFFDSLFELLYQQNQSHK